MSGLDTQTHTHTHTHSTTTVTLAAHARRGLNIKVMPGYFLSYFLHKHQMKATKTSQAYTVGTHGRV